jgi:hypothetical protein
MKGVGGIPLGFWLAAIGLSYPEPLRSLINLAQYFLEMGCYAFTRSRSSKTSIGYPSGNSKRIRTYTPT